MFKAIWFNKWGRSVIVFTVVIFAFYLFGLVSSQNKISNLEQNLSDVNLKKLLIRGDSREYELRKGRVFRDGLLVGKIREPATVRKVLSLAFFYQNTLEDPLFTSPGLDSKGFDKSIDELEKIQREFLDADLLPKPIFPINFLKQISDINKTEKTFVSAEITEKKAGDLLEAYASAQRAYVIGIDEFSSLYNEKVTLGSVSRFVFLNVASSARIVKGDLEKIKENAQVLKKEIASRKVCLDSGNCGKRPSYPQPNLDFKKAKQPSILPDQILFTSEFINNPKGGPYRVSTPCFGWEEAGGKLREKKHPFYVVDSVNPLSREKLESTFLKMADDVYFRKLSKDDPLDRERIEKGQDWSWFGETNSYECTNLEYQTVLATMDYFTTRFKKPILVQLNTEKFGTDKDIFEKMIKFEKSYFSSNFVIEENFNNLKNVYLHSYDLIKKHNLDSEEIPEKKKILERALVMDRQLGGYPEIINRVLLTYKATLVRDIEIIKEKKIGLENFLPLFLTTRSSYSLLFFPFSNSVWRSKEELKYLESEVIDVVAPENQFMTLNQARNKFSEAQIRSWYTVFIKQVTQKLK